MIIVVHYRRKSLGKILLAVMLTFVCACGQENAPASDVELRVEDARRAGGDSIAPQPQADEQDHSERE